MKFLKFVLEFVVWNAFKALRGPQNRFSQGLLDTPKSLISYRVHKSEAHVFILINMVY